jgi:hypothetical protein
MEGAVMAKLLALFALGDLFFGGSISMGYSTGGRRVRRTGRRYQKAARPARADLERRQTTFPAAKLRAPPQLTNVPNFEDV